LRSQLLAIHAATQEPPSTTSRLPASIAKNIPIRSDGWNRDKGIESGKEALRKARRAIGEDGEAIREYTELVLYFIKISESRAEDG
jgi:zinc finger HIT domain-containing protein 3